LALISSSCFLESQFIGLLSTDFFNLLSTSSILGIYSTIFSLLAKEVLISIQALPNPTPKSPQVSKRATGKPIKLASNDIQVFRLLLAFL